MAQGRVWGAFWLLGIFWGSSFLFIVIALRQLQPFTLVALRLGIGTLGLWAFLLLSRRRLPRDRSTLLLLVILGIFNPALPFLLVTWGQQFTDSAVAGILNGTVPLFSMVIAHFALADERITFQRLTGLFIGFLGILLIFGEDISNQPASADVNTLQSVKGQLAVLGAAACYGGTAVFVRRTLRDVDPLTIAAGSQLVALVLVALGALAFEGFELAEIGWKTWGAVGWLGFLGTTLAYIFLYFIIRQWGATRATLVTYVIPVVAFALGAIVLNESITWPVVIGGLLIIGAIAIVNRSPQSGSQSSASTSV